MTFLFPGKVQDFKESEVEKWNTTAISGVGKRVKEIPANFLLATQNPDIVDFQVEWPAMPKRGMGKWPAGFAEADKRQQQDEYCEWEVERDANGKLTKVTFTCEFPEYWNELTENDQAFQNALREVGYSGSSGDRKGSIERLNKDGKILHLKHENSTLDQAVEIAADATVLRQHLIKPDGSDISGGDLLKCFGEKKYSKEAPKRHSDPTIMYEINKWVRNGYKICPKQPFGIYIDRLETSEFRRGNKRLNERSVCKWSRGADATRMRLVLENPGGTLADIKGPHNRSIQYGSQFAEKLWIRIDLQAVKEQKTEVSDPLWTYIEGRDSEPHPTDKETQERLTDWFAKQIIKKEKEFTPVPLTFHDLLEKIPAESWAPFVVYDGFHMRREDPNTQPEVKPRFVVICVPELKGKIKPPYRPQDLELLEEKAFKAETLAIVSDEKTSSQSGILQCAGFDPAKGCFNWYDRERNFLEREERDPRWHYFGNSHDAFEPDTQGLGPWCGHVNGTIIMKEIEAPWVHWESSVTKRLRELPTNHDLMKETKLIFNKRLVAGGAECLERMVKNGVEAWFETRWKSDFPQPQAPGGTQQGTRSYAIHVNQWISHILLTTTISIAASTTPTRDIHGEDTAFPIPQNFFFNYTALSELIDDLPEIGAVPAKHYISAMEKLRISTVFEFAKAQGDNNKIASKDEGQAPWKVLGPSYEDYRGMVQVHEEKLLPKNVVIAMLMVDFW
ncbi:MAG: hypothetical protein M1839_002827 [Geoglossum umbratile]|nr:MAG: hypothetical protein M1839_002827 [Geoglossum umbratile]